MGCLDIPTVGNPARPLREKVMFLTDINIKITHIVPDKAPERLQLVGLQYLSGVAAEKEVATMVLVASKATVIALKIEKGTWVRCAAARMVRLRRKGEENVIVAEPAGLSLESSAIRSKGKGKGSADDDGEEGY